MAKLFILTFLIVFSNTVCAQAPAFNWSALSYGSEDDETTDLVTDNQHNVIETGFFKSTSLVLQTQTISQSPYYGGNHFYGDFYVAKYDSAGVLQWVVKSLGNYVEYAASVAVDNQNNIIIAGRYNGDTLTIGSIQVVNQGNFYNKAFIAKISATGTVLWVNTVVSTIGNFNTSFGAGYYIESVSTDAQGNIYTGAILYAASVNIGTITVSNTPNTVFTRRDAVFAKYDNNGTVIWAKNMTGTDTEDLGNIYADASGNLYASGYSFSDTLAMDAVSATRTGGSMYVLKINSSGNTDWIKRYGSGNDYALSITADQSGNVYFCGYFRGGTLQFGSYSVNNVPPSAAMLKDMFVARLSPAGQELWIQSATAPANSDESAVDLITDNNGCIYVTGTLTRDGVIGGFNFTNYYSTSPTYFYSDIFVAKYNDSGNVVWLKQILSPWETEAAAITTGSNGSLYTGGKFSTSSGGIIFDSTTVFGYINGLYYDAFVVKINSSTNNCSSPLQSNPHTTTTSPDVLVYPNPAANALFVRSTGQQAEKILITDITGRVVKTVSSLPGQYVDVSVLPEGIYFAKVILNDNSERTISFIIQR